MESLKGRKPRVFSVEFKQGAARRLLAGESASAMSCELAVKRAVLYRWRDAYRREGVGGLSRRRGRPPAGQGPPPKPPRDPCPRPSRRRTALRARTSDSRGVLSPFRRAVAGRV